MISEGTKEVPVSSVGSYAIVALCILVSDSTRGILFPTLFLNVSSMGGNALHLGWAVAALSAGKILSTPILGYTSDAYGYRKALVLSNSVLGAGCIVYILAQSVPWLVFAQFVVGLGAGSIGVNRSYAAEFTIKANRSQAMAYLTSVQHAGSTMTPMIGALLTLAPQDPAGGKGLGALLSRFNLPALVLFLTAMVCILLLLMVFEDRADLVTPLTEETVVFAAEHGNYASLHTHSHSEHSNIRSEDAAQIKDVEMETHETATLERGELLENKDSTSDEDPHQTPFGSFSWVGFAVGCAMNAAIKGGVSVYETLVMPYAIQNYHWSAYRAGATVSACATVGFVTILSVPVLMRACADVSLVQIGLVACVFSSMCLISVLGSAGAVPVAFFYASLGLLYSFGYPLGHTAMLGVVSKLTPSGPQGKIMGYFSCAGSLARIIFPILAGALYYYYEANVVFVMLTVFLLGALVLFTCYKSEILRAVSV